MRSNSKTRFLRMAALSVAAFVFCFALVGATHEVYGSADKKTYNKAYKALRKGDYEQAEKIFRELLNKDAHDIDARLGLSFTLLKQRSLQGAYDNAARVIMLDPLSARGHALLGAAILAAGEFRLSVEEFRTALALNENEALAVAGLAMVDFYENRLTIAMPGLRRAVSLDPEEPDFVFNLGQAAARSERYKEAADAYERFLLVAPKTDSDRRARIVGLIDFLRYLGRQGSLYITQGEHRAPFLSKQRTIVPCYRYGSTVRNRRCVSCSTPDRECQSSLKRPQRSSASSPWREVASRAQSAAAAGLRSSTATSTRWISVARGSKTFPCTSESFSTTPFRLTVISGCQSSRNILRRSTTARAACHWFGKTRRSSLNRGRFVVRKDFWPSRLQRQTTAR